jgi:hypothetical protein
MEKQIEICRSFSQTIQVRPFEPISLFASAKQECEMKDAESVAKQLFHMCRMMVLADIHAYLKEHPEIQYKEAVINADTLQYETPTTNKHLNKEEQERFDKIADKTDYYKS